MRLWFISLLLPLFMSPAQAQENDSEKIFRAMEKKIREAKAVQIVVAIDGQTAARDRAAKGECTVLLSKDNHLKIKASKVVDGVTYSYQMISDGKQMHLKPYSTVPVRKASQATPKYLHRDLTTMITGMGVESTLNAMPFVLPVAEFDEGTTSMKHLAAATAFKENAPENIAGREAKVISYQVGAKAVLLKEKEDKVLANVTLWIDSETLLPRKRVVRPTNGDTISETYSEFRLNPAIGANEFDLPK